MTELIELSIFAVLFGVWLAFGVKLWAEFFDRYGGF
jgi:hypothetical protein